MKRRELFSSLVSRDKIQEKDIRPPYLSDESVFQSECVKCDGACATLCEEQIIVIKDDKTPILDFSKSGCTYCDKCAEACKFGVLSVSNKKKIKVKIKIDMLKCLSWQKTMCFSCKDVCLDNAIEFLGLFRPEIVDDKCTSCGFCIGVCPTNAVILE